MSETTIDRTARSSETRAKTERKRSWTPPSRLDAPPAPPGYKQRWIRAESDGKEDRTNVAGKLREGYELVRAEEHENFVVPAMDDGRHAGVIGVGGLLLARIPEELAEERNDYYQQRTKDQLNAVDNDMMKTNAHSNMVINKPDRQSRITFGGPRTTPE